MHSEKVPYYILDLLQQVPSVIVPGLGRFDAIFHPAVIDISRSQIRPPHLEPGFAADAFEAEDILPTYIHYVSGIDVSEAQSIIRHFAADVHHRISEGQNYTIEKFGTFSKSSLPRSITIGRKPCLISCNAAKYPAGPAPIMCTGRELLTFGRSSNSRVTVGNFSSVDTTALIRYKGGL